MNVKVSRRDFPLLTEEISRLPKGPRRTNRLAHLATLGLCWERAVASMEAMPQSLASPKTPTSPRADLARAYESRLDPELLAALLDEGTLP
jgi:hypothetical protein